MDADALKGLFGAAKAAALVLPLTAKGPGRPPIKDTPEDLLKSEERRRLVEAVHKAPGAHLAHFQELLEMGGGEFGRNVQRLINAGLIEKHRIARHVRLYPPGAAPPREFAPLESEALRLAARAVVERSNATAAEVAEDLGLSVVHVRSLLAQLARAKFASVKREGLMKWYSATPLLREGLKRYPKRER